MSKNPSVESSEADYSSETVGSNWYDSTSMFKVKEYINNININKGNGDKKWEQEQDPLKTKFHQKMIASASSPTVTSRSLKLVSIFSSQSRGHFSNIFVEVFGNDLIFIFYLSIKAWEEKSLPKSHLGWFILAFGEGKTTEEKESIFWSI